MSVVELSPTAFADMCRTQDVMVMPVAIGGYLYAVIRGNTDSNIYRVSVT